VSCGRSAPAVLVADGTGDTLLTRPFSVSEGQPAWSPDGTKLLYRRTPQNPLVQNADTWVLDIAGSAADPGHPGGQPAPQPRPTPSPSPSSCARATSATRRTRPTGRRSPSAATSTSPSPRATRR